MNIKLTILTLILIVCFHLSGHSQNILERTVKKDYSGMSVIAAFNDLEQQHGVRFFYEKHWVQDIKVPDLHPNLSLGDFIISVLSKNKLSHIEIQEVNIVLIPSGYKVLTLNDQVSFIKPIGNALEKGKYILNKVEGYVRFGKTGDPVPGAVIFNKKHNQQTTSDRNGYYSIEIPGGMSNMEFSFMGMETSVIEVDVLSNGTLDCNLFDESIQLKTIEVSAFGGKNNVERTQMGLARIDMKSFEKLPVVMGDADIIKSMTLISGVQTNSELSSGFNVRGGKADQNQILINGAPIYNTSHLFGLFGALIPQSISNVELYKGTQSSNFGGRLSSVMDIQLKNPSNEKLSGVASTGLTSSSLFIEGPLIKNFCTISVGGRTAYPNWILNKTNDIDIRQSKADFYDFIGNIHFNLNEKNKLKIFGYRAFDHFKYSDKNVYDYGSTIAALNYQLLFGDRLSMNFNMSYTDYENNLSSIEIDHLASTVTTGINQILAKLEFGLELPKHQLLFGFEASDYNINPGIKEKYGEKSSITSESLHAEKAREIAGFISDDIYLVPRVSLLLGLRYSWYSKIGPAQAYSYQPNLPISEFSATDTLYYSSGDKVKPYMGFEPRIGIRYKLNSKNSIKVGYHVSRQYQHLISNSSIPTPSDYWKSADAIIKPMRSQQFSLGYFKHLMDGTVETSAELYYKEITNVLDYRYGAVLSMNPAIERDLLPGFSKAYGLEIMIKKNTGKFQGLLSYTLSKSLIKIESDIPENEINGGKLFPTYNDRLHDLSLALSYQLTRRMTLAGNLLFSSGLPATFPEKKFEYRKAEVVYFSERNKYRLEPFHRFDIALTYEGYMKKNKKVHPSFTFSIYNLYGHDNFYSTYFKNDTPSEVNNYNHYGLYKLSIIGAPIPTIKLNLKF